MGSRVRSIRCVAEELGLSYWTIMRLIKRGELASLKVGSRRLVLVDDVENFLRRKREAAAAELGGRVGGGQP